MPLYEISSSAMFILMMVRALQWTTDIKISPSHGLIIDPVDANDTDRYWCKTVRASSSQFVEDYLDVTVLDETFPEERDSIVSETSESMDIQSRNTIQCPLLPQLPTQTDFTVYWTIKNSDGQSLNIIAAKFPNGEIISVQEFDETHSLTGKNAMQVGRFSKRQEKYCCHVFEQDNDLRTACVDVTWLAVATKMRPTIKGCMPTSDDCAIEVTPHQECLQLECSINAVYPKPTLNWSTSGCKEPAIYFTNSSVDRTSELFNVKSTVYIVDLNKSLELCSTFTCTAQGEAITDQTQTSFIMISRQKETTTPSIATTCICPSCNSSGCGVELFFAITLLLIFLLLFLLLLLPRSKRFILTCAGVMPTLPRYPHKCAVRRTANEPAFEPTEANTQSQSAKDVDCQLEVTVPLMTIGAKDEKSADDKEGPVCFVNRSNQDVDITDPQFTWQYKGELTTESVLDKKYVSGFQSIKYVICMEDSGVVVIDITGLHQYTDEYRYRFVDLKRAFGNIDYACVTCFTKTKLIFGLKWGKLVIFDTSNEHLTNFASVTPVKGRGVELESIAVGSSGLVFASDKNGKAISIFDQEGVCLERCEIPSIEPRCLAAYVRNEISSFFVTAETVVRKYNITGQIQSSINPKHQFDIDKQFLGTDFKPIHISVKEETLFVVNQLDDVESLQILPLNVIDRKFQRSIIANAPGIRGVRLSSGDKVIVYSDSSVHLLEKKKK
ncbi:uncharacterized protein LOC110987704 isoform X4 [Acanthaster planci]|uniref:Uncharacterized protein LOC110987704 isoform X4 n=1 Tax=Acanthaster planci TaxID=133434 RepID=A0A8B7ZSF1_ACAPL|nr:uncharacterized protein LOC110987704 isoform X4 [Acanthaster planci]